MSLVTLNEVVQPAYRSGYAVPAFNFWTIEDAKAIIRGAEEEGSPVILMSSGSCVAHLGLKIVALAIRELAEEAKVPVVLHLDHAEDVDLVLRAIQCGYTSVMYDGSKLPMDDNVENTRFVVKVARPLGVSVEAEIGRVGRGEEGDNSKQVLTEPAGALEFFDKTRVDALAIAAGTSHGMQKQEAELRFDIIERIGELAKVPLVLHGSSGVKNDDLIRVAKTSISKINFGTRLRTAFVEGCRGILAADPALKNHLVMMDGASKAVTDIVREKIRYVGSAGR
jgi:ketose-bisphosphate aldolase